MDYGRNTGGFALPTLTPAVKRLLILNGIVFLVNMILMGRLSYDSTAREPGLFALSWSGLFDGYGLGLLRLVTYQFTHDLLSISHILFNMLVLYFFGTMSEQSLGYRGLFKLYFLAGIVGGAAQLLLGRVLGADPGIAIYGASGSCYGIMLYAACTAPHSLVIFIIFPIKLWVLAALLVGVGVYQLYVGMIVGTGDGTAHGAHLGGAAWGFLTQRRGWYKDYTPYAYREGLTAGWSGKLQRWRESRRGRSMARQQAVLDELLEKVHREGISGLSAAERRFLDRASKKLKRR